MATVYIPSVLEGSSGQVPTVQADGQVEMATPATPVTSVSGTSPIASSGGTTPAISLNDGGVTLAKMADLATAKIIGRSTAGTGVPEAIDCTAAGRALIDDADAAAQRTTLGLGALAVLGTVGAAQIDNKAVILAKLDDIATNTVIGRVTAGSGVPAALTATNLNTILATINLDFGSNTVNAGAFKVGGTQVVGSQGAAVADAAGGVVIDLEARAALNALLARLRTHGIIAT